MNIVEPIRNKQDLKRIEKYYLRDLLFFIDINCGLRISDILNRKISFAFFHFFSIVKSNKI